ncbi:MAG: DUF4185 domain-containing protein [Firmicutes bacterium]|nr:DUF4185 domain-containing protein [Bacillota bacterium]
MNFHGIPQSVYIKSFEWPGERLPYPEADVKGDTYPMTWAADGEIYASAGDPGWGESVSGLDVEKFTGGPTDYRITKYNDMNDYTGWGGAGAKPSGMICVDGMLYLAFQNFLGCGRPVQSVKSQTGSDAHIVCCDPKWNAWKPSFKAITEPMFPGSRFGGPAFVNFGKDNENARDGYVYAVSGDQWDNGSNVRLGRVPKERICDRGYWEFVSAFDKNGFPAWNRSLDEAIPILSIHRFVGLPEMVYVRKLNRYLFLTWRLHEDFSPTDGTDLLILEAPEPWGPFSLVYFEEYWEGKEFNPYCPRVPLKWIEENTAGSAAAADGVTGYMQFSGSWSDGGKGYYRSNVRRFRVGV